MIILSVIIIGILYYYLKYQNKHSIKNLIFCILYITSIAFLIYSCINTLMPYLLYIDKQSIYIFITFNLFLCLYLLLDFNKSIYFSINLFTRLLILIYYIIIFVILKVVTFENSWLVFLVFFLITIIIHLIAHLTLIFSNSFVKQLKVKNNELIDLKQMVLNQQKELNHKNKTIHDQNLTFHSIRASTLKAIELQDKGQYEQTLEYLINHFILLINNATNFISGYAIMDEVLKLYSNSLVEKKIHLDVNFTNIDLKLSEYDQILLFRFILDVIIDECNNESVRLISSIQNKSTYFILIYLNRNDEDLSTNLFEGLKTFGYDCSCRNVNGIKYINIYP